MSLRNICKINDNDLHEGDTYNDGTYSGKVKSVNSDDIVVETQNEEGDVVDVTIPKVSDGVAAIQDPTDQDIIESATDPEFICDLIEVISGGENSVTQYVENEDGTLDINIKRPITQDEAKELYTAGVRVGIEPLNKAGWVTISPNPIVDSDKFQQFITKLLFEGKATCPKTGVWVNEGGLIKNNGIEVAHISSEMPVTEAFEIVKNAVEGAKHIKDSELKTGDDYNDGTYSGKVKEVSSDNIRISSQDENGNEVEIDIPIEDSAVHTVNESNIDDILDKGETIVTYDPEETDPADIVSQIDIELSEYVAPGEEVPELDLEILSDNQIKVFVV